jgi:hypothetical protein
MDQLGKVLETILYELGGGLPIIPLRYVINTFKGASPLVMVLLMYYYQNFSLGAYLYVLLTF